MSSWHGHCLFTWTFVYSHSNVPSTHEYTPMRTLSHTTTINPKSVWHWVVDGVNGPFDLAWARPMTLVWVLSIGPHGSHWVHRVFIWAWAVVGGIIVTKEASRFRMGALCVPAPWLPAIVAVTVVAVYRRSGTRPCASSEHCLVQNLSIPIVRGCRVPD